MTDHFCDRCGCFLPEGSIRYTVHIQVLSDFDGMILFEGDDVSDDTQVFCNETDPSDTGDMEDDLFQELSFILCGKCKKRFSMDPFNRGVGLFKASRNIERRFH